MIENKEIVLDEEEKEMKSIRLIELFAGIGSQAKALERLGVPFEHYRMCEYDKYAVASYNAIHGTKFTTSDITKINGQDLGIIATGTYNYILTYSFPCTDLSLAGKQEGMKRGSGTRSGLLWEVERLLKECKELPQILLMENVTQVHGTKNKKDFELWIKFLESLGYKNYWRDLNAKDYGIPQNRNRCFMVSLLGEYAYDFPKPTPLKLRLKDMLEDEVDEKYYLSEKMIKYIKADNEKWTGNNGKVLVNKTIASTINTGEGSRRCDASNYIIPNIDIDNVNIKEPICLNSKGGRKGIDGLQPSLQDRVYDPDGISTAITTSFMPNIANNLRIRKLTPKECWRLMGFDDKDYEKASKVNSNAQLYKQAGNSIVVNVLEPIFKSLLKILKPTDELVKPERNRTV